MIEIKNKYTSEEIQIMLLSKALDVAVEFLEDKMRGISKDTLTEWCLNEAKIRLSEDQSL